MVGDEALNGLKYARMRKLLQPEREQPPLTVTGVLLPYSVFLYFTLYLLTSLFIQAHISVATGLVKLNKVVLPVKWAAPRVK